MPFVRAHPTGWFWRHGGQISSDSAQISSGVTRNLPSEPPEPAGQVRGGTKDLSRPVKQVVGEPGLVGFPLHSPGVVGFAVHSPLG